MTTRRASVVLASGHLVDAPGRPTPRFPPSDVQRVGREIAATLASWHVGPGSTIVTGGARGADILAAESGLGRGAAVVLCLALPPRQFEAQSVALPRTDWTIRFRHLLAQADVRVLSDEGGDDAFARVNEEMLDVARSLTDDDLHAVVVWDGEHGDGPGGTADFVRRAQACGITDTRLRIIHP